MITADQILAHLVGDYIIQSDWMAGAKRRAGFPALIHAMSYALPFLCITRAPLALAFILLSHFYIDRWGLARFVIWAKNFVGSPWSADEARTFLAVVLRRPLPANATIWNAYRRPWSECQETGYPNGRPLWLTTWLLIIADNTLHLLCNGFAIWGAS